MKKYLQSIIGIIAWYYWASQVTISEWAVVRDTLDFATTAEETSALDTAIFLHNVSLVAKSAFQTFNIMSKDAEPVRAHQKLLLVKPHHVIKRIYPKMGKNAPSRARTTTRKTTTAKTTDTGYHCECCDVFHLSGAYTAKGRDV